MKISEVLDESLIMTNLHANSKRDLIERMVELLAHSPKVTDAHDVLEHVYEREKIMTTGVGNGFAIPHGKSNGVTDLVAAFATLDEPVDYESVDELPVRLIFLMIDRESRTDVKQRISLLKHISKLMHHEEIRERFLSAPTPADVLAIFQEEETKLAE